jgi:hypothetical protein
MSSSDTTHVAVQAFKGPSLVTAAFPLWIGTEAHQWVSLFIFKVDVACKSSSVYFTTTTTTASTFINALNWLYVA